ncbi:P-loop containing nucleoside triphosphate hydrolase protein [Scleroderma yunnanense]
MPRRARIQHVSLKSSLVNLPISIYGPLLERNVRPQNLAVHLKLVSQNASTTEAYVGWTGLASASSLAHFNSSDGRNKALETIEIDPQYAQSLGFAEGHEVEIGLLHDLAYASSVSTEPVTSDDWEIIEIHASHVEATLLSQVRVAKVGQEINVWVMGRTRVRLTVVSLNSSSKGAAALLTADTEVSIAPKPHHRSKTTAVPRDVTSQKGPSETSLNLPEVALRALSTRLLEDVSPRDSKYIGFGTLAYVHPSTFSVLTDTEWLMTDDFVKLSYRHLPPPPDPLQAPRNDADMAPPRTSPQPGSDGLQLDNEKPVEFPADNVLIVGSSDKVMESHVYFPNGVGGIDDWHWIHSTSTGTVLSGVEQIIKDATNHLLANFIIHSQDEVVYGLSSILVTGRPGVGRTSVAREIAKRLEEDTRTYAYTHYIDFMAYSEKPMKTFKILFRHLYEVATWHRPTVLIFDNLDKVLSPEQEHADSTRSRVITELFISQFSFNARTLPMNFGAMVMIGIAESKTSIHPLVHTLHIFQEVYHIQPPASNARKEILANLIKAWTSKSPGNITDPDDPPNYAMIASHTEGYAPIDLQTLMKRSLHRAASRAFEAHGPNASQVTLSMEDFSKAQVDFVPYALKDVPLQKSDVEWTDIGGLKDAKRILRETMEWPTKYAPLFKQSPLRLRSGLLLYGYPGCGKTLLASAVSKECGLNFISIKGPELLNKYIGASEQSVRDIFDRASAAKPCVLFFDEFDSIAPKRGHDSTGVTDRVVNQLLTEMDGVEGLDGVFVLAATSRPDLIDSALLRPGRLDKSILCDMPDEEGRREILRAASRKVTLDPSVDFGEIAKVTAGFSGADLQALIYNAHLQVVHAVIDASPNIRRSAYTEPEKRVEYVTLGGSGEKSILSRAEESQLQKRLQQILENKEGPSTVKEDAPSTETKKFEITQDDFLEVLKTARPSVPFEELNKFRNIYETFVSSRSRNKKVFPSPPGSSGVGTRVSLG